MQLATFSDVAAQGTIHGSVEWLEPSSSAPAVRVRPSLYYQLNESLES